MPAFAEQEKEIMKELELYVHIPFCVRKCAYCDFLSFAADEGQKREYVRALLEEIRSWQPKTEYQVSSVFFGGGTPSVLCAEAIETILTALREKASFTEDAEITIECNPGTLTKEKLLIYKKCGINRLSIGLQSAQNEELKKLGRIHTYEEFLESFFLAREAGFDNLNVDLMSALPGQRTETWEDTLRKTAALAPEHLSAYSLIIEEGTPFYEQYAEEVSVREKGGVCKVLPSEEEERRMYERTEEILKEYGYHRYEISNYAKAGRECRHNCGYWRRTDYKGFGLGAASLLNNVRSANTADLQEYISGRWTAEKEALTKKEQMEETMFLGLRLMQGVSKAEFQKNYSVTIEDIYGDVLKKMVQQGLLRDSPQSVCLTKKGIDVSNYVLAEFLL